MSASDDGIKGQIAEADRIAFENAAPLSLQQLRDLFSYLNSKTQCNHTFSDTRSQNNTASTPPNFSLG